MELIGARRPSVLGVGRVCVDHFVNSQAPAARFDGSIKQYGVEFATSVGGSVPRALVAASATGLVSAHFVGWVAEQESEWIREWLGARGVTSTLLKAEATGYSVLEYDIGETTFRRLLSVDARGTQGFRGSLVAELRESGFSDIYFDAYHPEFIRALTLEWTEKPCTWLDPGSTSMSAPRRANALAAARMADCLLSDEVFAAESRGYSPQRRLLTCISGERGAVTITGIFGEATVRPPAVDPPLASLGAGDIFRGRLLAYLASSKLEAASLGEVRSAVAGAMAAAAWRLRRSGVVVPEAPGLKDCPLEASALDFEGM